MEKLESYKKALLEADRESDFEKVANQYSDDLLEFDGFHPVYLDFLVEIHSDSRLYTKKGLYHFLALLGVDTDIMTSTQLKTISDMIISNFVNYRDEMLCLTTCDFIAMYYPFAEAESVLLQLKHIENDKTEKGFADDGLLNLRTSYKDE